MRLFIFDAQSLNLERQLILDEDLEDFIVINGDELLGLCYYCEEPIRQYFLR